MPLTCYMCERDATSSEHAPPRCIFPKQKDLPEGVNLRKDLITVPSCDEHNTAKSKDDEYLLYVLPPSIASNPFGLNHFLGAVQRAISERPKLSEHLVSQAKEVDVHDTSTGVWFKALAVPLDMNRVNGVLEMNARAIYFHHYGRKFLGRIVIFKNFLLDMERPSVNEQNEKMFSLASQLFTQEKAGGANPEVFFYKFSRSGSTELLEMTFYGKNIVLAHLHHAASEA